jgi:hypothetical protein
MTNKRGMFAIVAAFFMMTETPTLTPVSATRTPPPPEFGFVPTIISTGDWRKWDNFVYPTEGSLT